MAEPAPTGIPNPHGDPNTVSVEALQPGPTMYFSQEATVTLRNLLPETVLDDFIQNRAPNSTGTGLAMDPSRSNANILIVPANVFTAEISTLIGLTAQTSTPLQRSIEIVLLEEIQSVNDSAFSAYENLLKAGASPEEILAVRQRLANRLTVAAGLRYYQDHAKETPLSSRISSFIPDKNKLLELGGKLALLDHQNPYLEEAGQTQPMQAIPSPNSQGGTGVEDTVGLLFKE